MVGGGGASPEALLGWQEMVVKATGFPPSPGITLSQTAKLTPALAKGKGKKSVSFGFLQSAVSPSSTSASTLTGSGTSTMTLPNLVQPDLELHALVPNLTASVATNIAFSSVGAALDLCGKLHQSQNQPSTDTYGTLIDQLPSPSRRYSLHPTPAPAAAEAPHSWSLISLRDVLEHKTRFPPLSYQASLRLAATISSSILQLHGTPWLPDILTSRHVFFLRKNISPSPDIYSHPVLLKHLPEAGPDQPAPADQTIITAERNPTLLSLGYVLIEVILGRTLDSSPAHRSTGGGAGVDPIADYVAAQSLMDEVRMKSWNYWTAVARCVDGELHKQGCGLEDGDLCQEVYSRVVTLLERDLANS